MRTASTWALVLSAALLGACAMDTAPEEPGSQLEIAVAPLDLTGVTDACYGLTVTSGTDEVVWSRDNLCASSFGDGQSALSYIGPCDASEPASTVTLVLESITAGGGTLTDQDTAGGGDPDFINPCPASSGCEQGAVCVANGDTPVTFNVTVMRRANQGFFDIAVNFDNLFCSAKADCVYPDGDDAGTDPDPIQLLHNARIGGARDQTMVLGLACTAGSATDTRLHWITAEIACDDGTTYDLLAAMGDGLSGNQGALDPAGLGAQSLVFQHAYYFGEEQLGDYGKLFANIAVGLDLRFLGGLSQHEGCSLNASATASDGALTDNATPAQTSYPLLEWTIPLNTGTSTALECTQHPLNGGNGLATSYTDGNAEGTSVRHSVDGDGAGTVSVSAATIPPSPENFGILAGTQVYRTDYDGALRFAFVVDEAPTASQRIMVIDDQGSVIGIVSNLLSNGTAPGTYRSSIVLDCSFQAFEIADGETLRFIMTQPKFPNPNDCATYEGLDPSEVNADFTESIDPSLAPPLVLGDSGVTFNMFDSGGFFGVTSSTISPALSGPGTLFVIGPAVGTSTAHYRASIPAGGTSSTVIFQDCDEGSTPAEELNGDQEYLVYFFGADLPCDQTTGYTSGDLLGSAYLSY